MSAGISPLSIDAEDVEVPPYRILATPLGQRIRAYAGSVCLIDSQNAIVMRETHMAPIYYVPQNDIALEYFRKNSFQTFCPFKGNASHWTLDIDGNNFENAAWSYENPLPEAAAVKNHLAFYGYGIDRWLIGDEEKIIAGPELVFEAPKTLIDWLIRGAWTAEDSVQLTKQLGHRLVETGIPVTRLYVSIRQLHPLLSGVGYVWTQAEDAVEVQQYSHEALKSDSYLLSPMKLVSEGLGGIRQRLNVGKMAFDFPILNDLKAQGATDYVAMPLPFSDGRIHNLSLASDDPKGFSTANLGQIFEALPIISRMYELHTLKSNSQTLLQTYLGNSAGNQVLNGLTKRGDGHAIRAVISCCDLTGSTQLTEQLDRKRYLELLDEFFECAGVPVTDNGGDILKFMGDAVLSIFPIDNDLEAALKTACQNAVQAARQTISALEGSKSDPKISCTIGIHRGEVTYGNVGSPQRLDFTVIGRAANETVRISDLCKTADVAMLMSEEVAQHIQSPIKSAGQFNLRGVSRKRELFVLDG